MILTYKIKHGRDFSVELAQARQVAEYGVQHKIFSSAKVKHFGLKSVIANQILRKYARNKNIKKVSSVNLIVPHQGVKSDGKNIYMPCLKLSLVLEKSYQKIHQIELNKEYAFVSVFVPESPPILPTQWLGIDLNATGHCAVVANETTGKVLKLGKKAQHIHLKYKHVRKRLQKARQYRQVKQLRNREARIVKDLNHKISRRIVNEAIQRQAGIVLENLKGIRKTNKQAKSFRSTLNSWSFYQLKQFLEYKAKLHGIPVAKTDPRYTSQQCSRCGLIGHRTEKTFQCQTCGHADHADANAAFVIAKRHTGMIRMPVVREMGMGTSDSPVEATDASVRP